MFISCKQRILLSRNRQIPFRSRGITVHRDMSLFGAPVIRRGCQSRSSTLPEKATQKQNCLDGSSFGYQCAHDGVGYLFFCKGGVDLLTSYCTFHMCQQFNAAPRGGTPNSSLELLRLQCPPEAAQGRSLEKTSLRPFL